MYCIKQMENNNNKKQSAQQYTIIISHKCLPKFINVRLKDALLILYHEAPS